MPAEFSEALDLPRFSDRLPDLQQALRQAGESLKASHPHQSYLPYWEDLYSVAHGLKGVLTILDAAPAISGFVIRITDILLKGLGGDSICRKNAEAAEIFLELAEVLNVDDAGSLNEASFSGLLDKLNSVYEIDLAHEERIREVPAHLFYVNEFVSKKAREIILLQLNHCAVEDDILLDEIPLWRTQLNEALSSPEFGRGLVVNFLPFISPEGSRRLKVWAWVAAATHSRAALKQRIKEILPKVTIAKA